MATQVYTPRLKNYYKDVVVKKMMDEFKYSSVMQVPKVVKVAVNQGVHGAPQDKKLVDQALQEMSIITGQKAVSTKARLAISNFKLRENMPIGARVTLRGDRMYEFIDRLVSVALPRVRDFRGINPKSFDGRGNYTLGVTEQIIFPEIDIDKVPKISGMDITIVTTAQTDEEALALLTHLGFPFKKDNK
jgi:large subunit ribosomal protein L5